RALGWKSGAARFGEEVEEGGGRPGRGLEVREMADAGPDLGFAMRPGPADRRTRGVRQDARVEAAVQLQRRRDDPPADGVGEAASVAAELRAERPAVVLQRAVRDAGDQHRLPELR